MAKIRFIVDESVDFSIVRYLRNSGFNVTSIAEDSPSLNDIYILQKAYQENRILLANDKDFGTLIFHNNLKSRGVILFRLEDQSSGSKIKSLELIMKNYSSKLSGNFVVVTEKKIRVRKLLR